MPLTPEDVSNKRFTTVRLREGYDMTEVDAFLDEVEAELGRILRENDDLRTRLEALQRGEPMPPTPVPSYDERPVEEARDEGVTEGTAAGDGAAADHDPVVLGKTETGPDTGAHPADGYPPEAEPVDEPRAAAEPEPQPEPVVEADTAPAPAPVAALAPESRVETLEVTTTAEASAAATRLLELATRNADELVSEARAEAEQLVTEARTTADQLVTEAMDSETEQRRQELLGRLEEERGRLNGELDNLRTFEREYRTELRAYFEDQLAALDGQGAGGRLPDRETAPPPDPTY